MTRVDCRFDGYSPDFDQSRKIAEVIAAGGNEFTLLVSWCDREKGVHSPCCLKCEFDDVPGWEVYGRNHDGRLRISIDDDRFVFIFS